jgi:hypothetical protein
LDVDINPNCLGSQRATKSGFASQVGTLFFGTLGAAIFGSRGQQGNPSQELKSLPRDIRSNRIHITARLVDKQRRDWTALWDQAPINANLQAKN